MGKCPQQLGHICTEDLSKLIRWPPYSFNYSLPEMCRVKAELNWTVQVSGEAALLSGNGVRGRERAFVNLTLPLGLYWKVQYLIRRWELSKNELKLDPT